MPKKGLLFEENISLFWVTDFNKQRLKNLKRDMQEIFFTNRSRNENVNLRSWNLTKFFVLSESSLSNTHFSQDSMGMGRPFLIPHYQFHPLNRHQDISWAITVESSPLHIISDRTQVERKSPTTKRKFFIWPSQQQIHNTQSLI